MTIRSKSKTTATKRPRASSASTFKTLEVLAGAYKGRRTSLKVMLTHTVEYLDDREVRVLCGRVELDSLADEFSGNTKAVPTCKVCLSKDPRFQGQGRPWGWSPSYNPDVHYSHKDALEVADTINWHDYDDTVSARTIVREWMPDLDKENQRLVALAVDERRGL